MTLSLFGGPNLSKGRRPIKISPFQSALLGVLAGHEGLRVSRRSIAEFLWDPTPEPVVRRRLSQLLYTLSKKVGDDKLILTSEDDIWISFAQVSTDLDEFHDALQAGELKAAFSLLDMGFLLRCRHIRTKSFEDWLQGKRLRYRALVRDRATAVWASDSAKGDWKGAANAADVLLALKPNDESVMRRAVEARALAGEPEKAEALFETFCEHLRRGEVNEWQPAEATTELMGRIGSIERLASKPVAIAISEHHDPELIGREDELATMSLYIRERSSPELRFVVVTGEAGVGKTRLVREALRPAPLDGVRVLRGRCAEFERDISLSGLLEAFTESAVQETARGLSDPWRTVMISLLPELQVESGPLPEVPYIQPGELPRRLFEALRQLLRSVVAQAPTVLFLDDFHWADETTVTALEYFSRRWDAGSLTIVLALRPEGLAPSPRVSRFIADLRSRKHVESLDLRELSAESAEALVLEVAEKAITLRERRALATLGGCIPFFVIELTLEHLAGRLPPQPQARERVHIPLSIQQVLEDRLSNLSPQADLALKALAVAGQSTGITDLTKFIDVSGDKCATALEQLQSFRLIKWAESGVMLRHEIIRHAVYAIIGEPLRRWLHSKVATRLHLHDPLPLEQLALHYHRAGRKELALHFSVEAATKAEKSGGVAEALRYLTIALYNAEEAAEATNITGKLAHLHYLHRDFAKAGPLLIRAAGQFRAQGRFVEALSAETESIHALSHSEADLMTSLEELDRIKLEARAIECWDVVSQALDVEVHIRDREGDVNGVISALNEVKECLDQESPAVRCSALCTLALNIFYGSPDDALTAAHKAVQVAEKHELAHHLLRAQHWLFLVLVQQGRANGKEARDLYARSLRTAERSGDLFSRFNLRLNFGVWLLDIGCYDQALVALEHAGDVIEESEAPSARRTLLYNLGELHFQRNEVDQALVFLEDARDLLVQGPSLSAHATIHAGLGLCALYRGDIKKAHELEKLIPPDPPLWFYDPSTVAVFKARMLERRGQLTDALAYLGTVSSSISGRLVINWLKLKIEQMRLTAKVDRSACAALVDSVRPTALQLGLSERLQEIERFLR